MTKKDRIAELERRVAELESQRPTSLTGWYTCSLCGTRYMGAHACWTVAQPNTWTSSGTDNIRLGGDNCAAKAKAAYSYGGVQ